MIVVADEIRLRWFVRTYNICACLIDGQEQVVDLNSAALIQYNRIYLRFLLIRFSPITSTCINVGQLQCQSAERLF
jgi:hypothetical protein